MRTGWLCFASLLLGGSAAHAQYPGAWRAPTTQGFPYASYPTANPYAGAYAANPYAAQAYAAQAYSAQAYAANPYAAYGYGAPQAQAYGQYPYGAYPAQAYRPGPMVQAQAVAPMKEAPKVVAPSKNSAGETIVPAGPNTFPGAAPPAYATEQPIEEFGDSSSPLSDGEPYFRKHNNLFWLRADYTMSLVSKARLATPLITRGSATDLHPGGLNRAENPGTSILLGAEPITIDWLDGFRVETGLWLDSNNEYSVDAIFTAVAPSTFRYRAISDAAGDPIITRPFFSSVTNDERGFATSFPGAAAGYTDVTLRTDMWGLEFNTRYHGYVGGRCHLETLFGFRAQRFEEVLQITDRVRDLLGGATFKGRALNAGDVIVDTDRFQGKNQFYGFQAGGEATIERPWFAVGFRAKAALGVIDQEMRIRGATQTFTPLGSEVALGGLLAQMTNIGEHQRYVFGVIPEFGANLKFKCTDHLRLNVGYTFLLWNSVLRPGNQIDRVVNAGIVPGSQFYGATGSGNPAYLFKDETLTVHAFNFGLEFHY